MNVRKSISLVSFVWVIIYLLLFQRTYVFALATKAVGNDEPCPWSKLLRYPFANSHFGSLLTKYGESVRPLDYDPALNIQRFDTTTRPFWIKKSGGLMEGKALLVYVLAEEDWIMGEAPGHGVRRGDVVIDVGAHVGTFDDDALRLGASKVIMVEPDPINVECIRRNFAAEIADGRAVVIAEGAWSSVATMDLNVGVANSGTGSFIVSEIDSKKVQVNVRPLDSMVRELGLTRVDFIKMDIEGAEREALKGASQTLRTFKPRLMLDAYHLPDDSVVIPKVIRGANESYRTFCALCAARDSRDGADHRIVPYALFFE